MNEELYNIALKSALTEIKNACTGINWSFILKDDGTLVSGEDSIVDSNMTKAANSFQSLAEKAGTAGGLDSMLIEADKGKVYASNINNMYFVAGLSEGADLTYFRTVTRAVLPTILKVLDNMTVPLTPTPTKPSPFVSYPLLKPDSSELSVEEEHENPEPEQRIEEVHEEVEKLTEPEKIEEPDPQEPAELQVPETETQQQETAPSQQLIVDRFGGLMVKADTVQLDADILERWRTVLNMKAIHEVDIETFSGKTARCKTKVINDSKLEGRGFVRIPEKTCQLLDVRRGELVRVKPVLPEESD